MTAALRPILGRSASESERVSLGLTPVTSQHLSGWSGVLTREGIRYLYLRTYVQVDTLGLSQPKGYTQVRSKGQLQMRVDDSLCRYQLSLVGANGDCSRK